MRAVQRLRYTANQLRRAPELREVEAAVAAAYSLPGVVDSYRRTARDGLNHAEQLIVDRYLRPGDCVLIVGCGTGREALALASQGMRVVGTDLSGRFVDLARQEAAALAYGSEVTFHVMPLSKLGFSPASFDALLISCDIYNRIPRQRTRVAVLKRCRSLLRPDGVLILAVYVYPNASRRERWLIEGLRRPVRWLLGDRIPEEGDRWLDQGPEEFVPPLFRHHFRDDAEVRRELEAAGMTVQDQVLNLFVARGGSDATDPHVRVDRDTALEVELGSAVPGSPTRAFSASHSERRQRS